MFSAQDYISGDCTIKHQARTMDDTVPKSRGPIGIQCNLSVFISVVRQPPLLNVVVPSLTTPLNAKSLSRPALMFEGLDLTLHELAPNICTPSDI